MGSTNVANLVAGLTGTVTVVINLVNGGNTGSFRLDDFTLTGNVVSIPSPPVLTTPTAYTAANTPPRAPPTPTLSPNHWKNKLTTCRPAKRRRHANPDTSTKAVYMCSNFDPRSSRSKVF